MKISASIYSDKKRPLEEVVKDLEAHNVDILHVDCNDDPSVFEDIQAIRKWTAIPIDLHIITTQPSKYYALLEEFPVEYVTFQYEDLQEELVIPSTVTAKKGIAIITPTSIEIFENFKGFDFILIMATIPGQSGGVFDKVNFTKIRSFKTKYPSKAIHVDGGVNGEVSFILRNMGVDSSVSGSYLFNAPSIGHALMNLTKREIESHYQVSDFMIPFEECPSILIETSDFLTVLTQIENGKYGFTLVTNTDNEFIGIISNADIRKGLIQQIRDLNQIKFQELINRNALTVFENTTVDDMLRIIKKSTFPISYLPVLNYKNQAVGVITFFNLIKGEL
jgi:ribulose-phosphate 3-epimerase